jgi:hypothetical protein
MKIGIVTYAKCDNYGAELQAYALQWKLNQLGYDAELIDLEKKEKDLASNKASIIPAIRNRFKVYGWKAPWEIMKLCFDVLQRKISAKENETNQEEKHKLFIEFFEKNIRHSAKHYTLEEIRTTKDLDYDVYIAGSDQIWNYMHTDYLDVYFLEFAKKFHAKRISYAASVSAASIPTSYQEEYKRLIPNIQYLSVRELQGAKTIEQLSGRKAEVVLDPTLLITKEEWSKNIARNPLQGQKYVLVYTLSGSKYITRLCESIANRLGCKVVNMKINFRKDKDDRMDSLFDLGPAEWVGLISGAEYVVTDSFHGTAFSINYNKPFTTLVNPVSNMNSRVLSILEITGLTDRIIYDDGKNRMPESLTIDYAPVNKIINEWRDKSLRFIHNSLDS